MAARFVGNSSPVLAGGGGPGASCTVRSKSPACRKIAAAAEAVAKAAAQVAADVLNAVLGPVLQSIASCVTHPTFASCAAAVGNIILIGVGFADADLAGAAVTCGGESFSPGTKVLLANGRKTPISRLRRGQKVRTANTRTGKDQAGTITAVLLHHDTNLYDLRVRARGQTSVISTTSNHLFWDQAGSRWVKAAALRYGTRLRTPAGGAATVLGGHAPRDRSGWMWDLTIPGNHDFYVRAAGTAVLVHNCGDETRALESGFVEPTELHHVLPQQFRDRFTRAGLDVDAATVRLPSSVHQAAHDVGWNSVWGDFFAANPNATRAEIIRQAGKMMWEFGLDKYSQGVEPYK